MPLKNPRLAALLHEAAVERGGQAALARALGLGEAEVSALINGSRFVSARQAVRIEKVLSISARDLLLEVCADRVDVTLARARAKDAGWK